MSFLVIFATGEGGDRKEWPIGVFPSEEAADSYARDVTADLARLGLDSRAPRGASNQFTRSWRRHRVDYTGASAFVSDEIPDSPSF